MDAVTCVVFNPIDDHYFLSGALDDKVRIWSIPDHQVVDWSDLREMVTAVCYTPDGEVFVLSNSLGRKIYISEFVAGRVAHVLIFNCVSESNCWFVQRDMSILQHLRYTMNLEFFLS